ncbi:MAG TPA: NAD(P)-dependent oxidoreductase [Candidatus Saccharimonadales bacterium]|nr:NAD(P)-dependent oxidoreductase [Candidatus Saccharimonadales bacterium]
MKKKKFLITGATGFVGSCLARRLVEEGEDVSILVRDKKNSWRINDISKKMRIYECDLIDPLKTRQIVSRINPTHIFHLAAYGALPQEQSFEMMVDVNIKGTHNLLTAAVENGFDLFIHTGSSSEYGTKNASMKENDELVPINDYGVTKAAASLLVQSIAEKEKLPIIIFRLFSPFGYFEQKDRLIPSVILSALKNKPILLSSPSHVRDFIFIEDVMSAYLSSAKKKITQVQIVNIGSGKQRSVEDLVRAVVKLTGSKSKVRWGAVKKQKRQKEPEMWQANISKAKKVLSWQPTHSLEEGLVKTIAWFGNNSDYYEHG